MVWFEALVVGKRGSVEAVNPSALEGCFLVCKSCLNLDISADNFDMKLICQNTAMNKQV